jgi:hypothetical protein
MQVETVVVKVLPDGRMDTRNSAAYLGLSEKTLAMMRCDGKGPRFIKKGRIFYFKEDLDSWVGDGERVQSTAQARVAADRHAA